VHATDFTTNNPAENFNKKLKDKIKSSRRPNVWKFVILCNEVILDSCIDFDFDRHTQGLEIARPQAAKVKANLA
jgi:hypothetical protein